MIRALYISYEVFERLAELQACRQAKERDTERGREREKERDSQRQRGAEAAAEAVQCLSTTFKLYRKALNSILKLNALTCILKSF